MRQTSRRDTEALVAERDFLLRSLEDLELEHGAGDVDDADYETLRADYVARAASTLRAISESEGKDPPRRPARGAVGRARGFLGRRATRRALALGTAVCVLCAVLVGALSLAGVRLPGEGETGSVRLPPNESVTEQLALASSDGAAGDLTDALALYSAVLAREPHNAEALTDRAWLIRLAGIAGGAADEVRAGDSGLAEAAATNPKYALARAFDGLALLDDRHDPSAAATQFRGYLADRPPASLASLLGPEIAQAYLSARVAVPPAFVGYLGSKSRPAGTGKAGG